MDEIDLTAAKSKVVPNLSAMKKIKLFCDRNNIKYGAIEDAWLNCKITSDKS